MHQLFAILGASRETVRNYLLSFCYQISKTQCKNNNNGTIYDTAYKQINVFQNFRLKK